MKLTHVYGENDWAGLYQDGVLVLEDDSIDFIHFLNFIDAQLPVTITAIDVEYLTLARDHHGDRRGVPDAHAVCLSGRRWFSSTSSREPQQEMVR